MTAIEVIEFLMNTTKTNLSEIAEYAELGTKANVCQMLHRKDLKVETFAKMLGVMGYQLVVQNTENDEDILIDY